MSATDDWRARYEKRIRSAQWRNMKADLIRLRGDKCERCSLRKPLELHHRTYERLGRELMSDLLLLCSNCHKIADEERAAEGHARSAAALYEAGLDTYATKKYGEEWWSSYDRDCIEEEFDRWLELHQNDGDEERYQNDDW